VEAKALVRKVARKKIGGFGLRYRLLNERAGNNSSSYFDRISRMEEDEKRDTLFLVCCRSKPFVVNLSLSKRSGERGTTAIDVNAAAASICRQKSNNKRICSLLCS
jgi:hypothetical protein